MLTLPLYAAASIRHTSLVFQSCKHKIQFANETCPRISLNSDFIPWPFLHDVDTVMKAGAFCESLKMKRFSFRVLHVPPVAGIMYAALNTVMI